MPFPVKKTLKLDFLGEGWEGAYINFSGLTFKETRGFAAQKLNEQDAEDPENVEFVLSLLKDHFLDGKGFNGTDLSDLTADDIEDLPVDVIGKSVELLAGGPNAPLSKD